ncbi:MAG: four helix bundle protein [Bacteroidota bacterium]
MGRVRHNYKNLKIWMLGLELAKYVSEILENFPKNEQYGLTSQISRCSISIPSNIAEGSAGSDKSFSHYLDVALGSSFELSTQLIIANHKGFINKIQFEKLESKIEEWQRMTMGFQNALE